MYCSSASSESPAIVCPHGFLGHRDQAVDSLQTGSVPHGAPPLLPSCNTRAAKATGGSRSMPSGVFGPEPLPVFAPPWPDLLTPAPRHVRQTTACPPRSLRL